MLTKIQVRMLDVFNFFEELTFRQVKERSKQKSNNVVQIALKEFERQGIVKTTEVGDVTTYRLDLDDNLAVSYLGLNNEVNIKESKLPKDILTEIQSRILKHTPFFVLAVFGSYAKAAQKKGSDFDIAVIVEKDTKEIAPFIETVKRRELINIDYHIFTVKDFLEMLKQEQENIGKQIYKNSIIFYGFNQYLSLIKK